MSGSLIPVAERAVTVAAAPHPFKVGSELIYMPEGMTLAQMLEAAQPDPILARHAVIFIHGHIIPRQNWARVRPKAGTHIEVRVVPAGGGGGKNPLRMILMIAVFAAAFFLGPIIGPAIFPEAGLFGVGADVLGQSLVGLVGMLLVNVIAPVKPPKLNTSAQEKPPPFIEGARNRARPFEPVPVILGKIRTTPAYGSSPYTEIQGGDHYLRLLFVWGVGPLQIESVKIGETPIEEFDEVEIEHRQGYDSDLPLTLYPDTVLQDDLQVRLKQADGWTQRTTGPDADEIGFDISFPYGLVYFHSNGKQDSLSVSIQVQYRKVGDVTWLTPSFDSMSVPASWVSGDTITFTYKKTTVVRDGFRLITGERAQYEIRWQRTTADHDTEDELKKYTDQSYLTALRTFTNEDPIQSAVPVAKTAVRIKATDQLNGVIDELNGIVTTLGKDWNGSVWDDDQPIQNPASLFRHVLQGKGIAEALADTRIDITGLQDFHDFCEAKGFKFNQARDFVSSVWETLFDVAGAGRAAPQQIDGKWSVVIDDVRPTISSYITPRNSFGFSAEKLFPDVPHAWRVPFSNENEGYRTDEYRVYQDGYSRSNATKFETLNLVGVTDPDQVYKLGRYRIAQGISLPERWSFSQDMEFLTYSRGARVSITHDVLLLGLASGRIKAVEVDTNNDVLAVTLDVTVEMEGAKDYGLAIRTASDATLTAQVATVSGESQTLTFSAIVPNVGGQPAIAVGDVFGFGELGQETDDASIIDIQPQTDFRARIIAVPYRAAVYAVDSEEIPPFTTNLTPLPAIPAPTLVSIVSDETALARGIGDALITRIMLSLLPVQDERLREPRIEIHGRPSETGEPWRRMSIDQADTYKAFVQGVNDGDLWDLRVRYQMNGLLLPGPWTYIYNHLVVGKGTPPDGLLNMTISVFGNQAYIRWDQPYELDVRVGGKVQFRHAPDFTGASWGSSVSIGTAALANSLFAALPLKGGTYLARVIDAGNTPSDTIASVTTKQASVLAFGNVDTLDEAPSFLGTHTNTLVSAGALQLAADGLWDDIADFDAETTIDWFGTLYTSGTYDFLSGIDLTTVKRVRLTTRITATSYNVNDLVDERDALIDDWEDIDGSVQSAGDVIVSVRHTDDDPATSGASWSAWERLDSAEFEARGFDFKAALSTTDAIYNIAVSELGIDVEEVV